MHKSRHVRRIIQCTSFGLQRTSYAQTLARAAHNVGLRSICSSIGLRKVASVRQRGAARGVTNAAAILAGGVFVCARPLNSPHKPLPGCLDTNHLDLVWAFLVVVAIDVVESRQNIDRPSAVAYEWGLDTDTFTTVVLRIISNYAK